jgi:hypothetical protein
VQTAILGLIDSLAAAPNSSAAAACRRPRRSAAAMSKLSREWRRFRDRRLKPFVRRLIGDPPVPEAPSAAAASLPPPPVVPPSIEPLVVALIRSELRRRAAFGGPPRDASALTGVWRPDPESPAPLETLVTVLLTAGDPAPGDAA